MKEKYEKTNEKVKMAKKTAEFFNALHAL